LTQVTIDKSYTDIPKNWIFSNLSEIAKIQSGYGFPVKYQGKKEGSIPFFKVGDISKTVMKGETHLTTADNYISYEECKKIKAKVLKKGTIVFARIGEAIKLNRRAILGQDSLIDNNVAGVFSYFDNLYLYHFLLTVKFGDYSRATTVPSVRKTDIEEIQVPVPPLNEQKRIVSKLEELFTKLDAGIEYLKKTKILLKQHRQSVLKFAFEGKMTEKWREKQSKLPSSRELYQQLIELNKNKPRKDFPPLIDSDLMALPNEWIWIRINDIVEVLQYGSSEKASEDSRGIPVLRMGNIQDGNIIFENLKYYPAKWNQLNEFLLTDGDILFNRTNSAELVGKSAVYSSVFPKSVFASYLIRIRVLKNWYNPRFLSHFINSTNGRNYIKSVVSQQVGQANVNGTKLAGMPLPFLPIEEQNIIAEQIETKFSIIRHNEGFIQRNINQCQKLRESILKNAFKGKLVSQDPHDEPASHLVEKIKQKIPIQEKNYITKRNVKDKHGSRQKRFD
jgi:type I restriction enzyme S subunit